MDTKVSLLERIRQQLADLEASQRDSGGTATAGFWTTPSPDAAEPALSDAAEPAPTPAAGAASAGSAGAGSAEGGIGFGRHVAAFAGVSGAGDDPLGELVEGVRGVRVGVRVRGREPGPAPDAT